MQTMNPFERRAHVVVSEKGKKGCISCCPCVMGKPREHGKFLTEVFRGARHIYIATVPIKKIND